MAFVRYLWTFGDGRTSTEPEPTHVYQMPGKYFWTVDAWDQYGNHAISSGTVYVYDWDYETDRLHVTYTEECFRAAITQKQGVGVIPWGGEYWVWPEAYTGTCKAKSKYGEGVSLVLNRRNGRFYRVGIPELWTDRTSQYDGQEIPTRWRLKEHVAAGGEHKMVEHVETHGTFRPYDEDYRGAAGYTADGLRDAQQITVRVFKDGEQTTPWAKVQRAPIYGDYIYGKRAKGKRLQAEFETTASGFRQTKVRQLHKDTDERVGPKYAVSAESNWQRDFATPDLWLVRNKRDPLKNKGTGQQVAGSYQALITGPDGVSESGMAFGAADGLNVTLPIISEATCEIWLSLLGGVGNVWVFPQFTVSLVLVGTDYYLRFTNGVWTLDQILEWDGILWNYIAFSVNLGYIKVYENGVQKIAWVNPGITGFGGVTQVVPNLIVSAFNVRRVPRVVNQGSLEFLYDNVVNEAGYVLPMQR